jgi:hypothetical protein
MNDRPQMFDLQAEWQKNRARLSWPEKIRMAEALRETLCRFRSLKTTQQRSEKGKDY